MPSSSHFARLSSAAATRHSALLPAGEHIISVAAAAAVAALVDTMLQPVARAFEILDSVPDNGEAVDEMPTPMMSVLATPAASVRPLRVTDSPFPVKEDEDIDEAVDWEAEEFIRQFYEQLQLLQG
ncbi:uncharacterized protein LOC110038226 [Phalaenopsis equestris]|uniref:uncharacterized protein LOC110038226 n=1 Tax=Phalaenopsis equestris TaxID=78828 RepID=UPI0009E4E07F|nr:uncharacterized protein LOC110038226 [Phalaenopsis equestris]